MQGKFSEKVKRHIPWEAFWSSITLILIGIGSASSGIFNFYNWGLLFRIIAVIVGFFLAIFGFFAMKKSRHQM